MADQDFIGGLHEALLTAVHSFETGRSRSINQLVYVVTVWATNLSFIEMSAASRGCKFSEAAIVIPYRMTKRNENAKENKTKTKNSDDKITLKIIVLLSEVAFGDIAAFIFKKTHRIHASDYLKLMDLI